jgi:hypothetical protein
MRWGKDKESINRHKSYTWAGSCHVYVASVRARGFACLTTSRRREAQRDAAIALLLPAHTERLRLCVIVCGTTLQTVMRRKGTNPMPLQHPDDPVLCMCCSHATDRRGR